MPAPEIDLSFRKIPAYRFVVGDWRNLSSNREKIQKDERFVLTT
jgi:hypothetical protein